MKGILCSSLDLPGSIPRPLNVMCLRGFHGRGLFMVVAYLKKLLCLFFPSNKKTYLFLSGIP